MNLTPSPRRHPRLARAAAAGLTVLTSGRPALMALGVAPVPAAATMRQQGLTMTDYSLAQDGVLGTSLDLIVRAARPGDAVRCQEAVLTEIERLRTILSTYDPASEISRVSLGLQHVSTDELRELLTNYDLWSAHTGGAVDARLNHVVSLWREAARTGRRPDEAELRAALNAPGALNVDALGKATIIDRAVAIARRLVPAGLLNIGGDLRAWGDVTWQIGVADPLNPAENAPLLATFLLRDAAVATSGDYARPWVIAGRSYSHLIDPRTLQPTDEVRSATVVAADCLTANALAAALSVLGPPGIRMISEMSRTLGHLVVDRTGGVVRGGLFVTAAASGTPAPEAGPNPPAATAAAATPTPAPAAGGDTPTAPAPAVTSTKWPKKFQLTINLMIGGAGVKGYRPYVAFWIENAAHKTVRTLCTLGQDTRFNSHLTDWRQAGGSRVALNTVSRATRPNGLYAVAWDGTDDNNKPLPKGTYIVYVELVREEGRHTLTTATVVCDDQPHSVDLAATVESGASKIEYGPKAPTAPDPVPFYVPQKVENTP